MFQQPWRKAQVGQQEYRTPLRVLVSSRQQRWELGIRGRSSEDEVFTGGSTVILGQVSPSEARVQTRDLEVAGQEICQFNPV